MKHFYLLLFFCGIAITNPAQAANCPITPPADTLIKVKVAATDNYVDKHPKRVVVLVKVPGKSKLVRVFNEKWPDEIEYTFNIVTNDAGKVILIMQTPFSESGDWDIIYKHYFDEHGNTIAFYRVESIFDDNIKGGVARKETWKYYAETKLLVQINTLLDVKWKPLKANENQLEFRNYNYHVYRNLKDCLAGYGITVLK